MMQENFYKILVVGPTKSGKSTLIHYFLTSNYDRNIDQTIGADFSTKQIGELTFQFWDIAGPERFQDMSKVYFANSTACILVVDNSNRESFDTDGWKECIWNWEQKNTGKNIGLYMIALNKTDIEEQAVIQDGVLKNTPLEWAIDYEIPVVKTSAKTGKGIKDLKALLVNRLIEKEEIPHKALPLNSENVLYIPESWDLKTRKTFQTSEKMPKIETEQTKKHLNDQALKRMHENIERFNRARTFERSKPVKNAGDEEGSKSTSVVSKDTIKASVRESDTKGSSNKLSRAGFREQTIDHYCPSRESDKIKGISELNFNLLLEIIRENTTEDGDLKPDKPTQYYIAFNIYKHFNMETDSIRCLEQIISFTEEIGSLEWKSFALNKYAEILKEKDEYDSAIDYYQKALEIDRELDDPESIASELHNIASLYYNQENYSKALEFFKKTLEIDKKLNILSNQANRQWWIGSVFSKINKTQNALKYLKKALSLYNKLGYSEEAEEIQSIINNIQPVQNKP